MISFQYARGFLQFSLLQQRVKELFCFIFPFFIKNSTICCGLCCYKYSPRNKKPILPSSKMSNNFHTYLIHWL